MEVILLERIGKLGKMGDVVRVKEGYARNFLLPNGKALRATKDNKSKYEGMKAELEAKSLAAKGEAGKTAAKLEGKNLVVIRQASESGQLYGSVSTRDIASGLSSDGITVSRTHLALNAPIKTIGQYKVPVHLHPEIDLEITVTVARSADEAERIARGEDVTVRRDETEEEQAAADAEKAAEALFDPEVAEERKAKAEDGDGETAEAEEKPAKKSKKKAAEE